MRIAVYTNTRTTYNCCINAHTGFMTAFRGGQVLGFTLVGLALLILHLIVVTFKATWFDAALLTITADCPVPKEGAARSAQC
jgi:Na+/H+-translocating membrane pyrophosphatase